MSALARALEERDAAITQKVVDAMFQNPFWASRFPDRGRRFSEEDGLDHLSYVRQALEAKDPEIFVRYARWLQPVLTRRGMCSRHLAESFERLAQALPDAGLESPEPAQKILLGGAASLTYREGPAVEVERCAAAAGRLALETLDESLPGWQQGLCDAPAPTSGEQARYWTSYVVDAVALGSDSSLRGYFEWLGRFLETQGKPARLAGDIRGALRYGFSSQKAGAEPAVAVLDALDGAGPGRPS
jgi:hypothetical protein